MRIHLDNVNVRLGSKEPLSGPNSFARRFAEEAIKQGHTIELDDGSFCDITLVFIERTGRPCAKRVCQRIDGTWMKPNEFYQRNANIKATYEQSNGVVFQSNFDKNFIVKHWNLPNKSAVIHNGINFSPVTKFSSPALEKLRQEYKKVFVCSANWHAQKRLQDNINLFLHIQKTIEPKSCLIVMGGNPDYSVASPHIFYTGSQPEPICLEVYSMADWMICLEWLSHCPNVVVEALSQGTPIICSSTGGTAELVKNFGVQLHEKQEYRNTLEDYDNPPRIDHFQLTNLPDKTTLGPLPRYSIEDTVKQYVSFFEELLT